MIYDGICIWMPLGLLCLYILLKEMYFINCYKLRNQIFEQVYETSWENFEANMGTNIFVC